jgi:hypothetical protein
MLRLAGMVARAVPTTISDMGSVASTGVGLRLLPAIPPTVTMSTVPLTYMH